MISLVVEELTAVLFTCHLVGMSSTVSSPLLYGFLNQNFTQERALPGLRSL
jgi:hypothetical protein